MRIRAYVLLSLLASGGCNTLDADSQSRLASHQRNAALFFEGGRLEQALGQIERGLEISPYDYKLRALQGAILLRSSTTGGGTDNRMLDEAAVLLGEVYRERSPQRHEPYLLLYYARAIQKQGLRDIGEAIRLEGQAARTPGGEAVSLRSEARSARSRAQDRLREADRVLAVLGDRGELQRVVCNHRLQIARQLGDDQMFQAMAARFLEQTALDQQRTRAEIERTTTPEYEAQQALLLRELREEEVEVRALVAQWHYDGGRFQEALVHLNRMLEIDPARSIDYYNRGRVLQQLDQPDAAKADFRRFLATTTLPASSEKTTFAVQAIAR